MTEKKENHEMGNTNLKEIPSYIQDKTLELALERLKKEYKEYKELYLRSLEITTPIQNEKLQLILMQFNILSDASSGSYSGKSTFVKSPFASLHWKYRGFRVCEEIIRNNTDVVVLEECDQYKFIEFYLKPHGYIGIQNVKKSSPSTRIGKSLGLNLPPDGIAIFYRKSKFILIDKYRFNDNEVTRCVGLALHLKSANNDKKHFMVFGTHLKATKDYEGEKKRVIQLQYMLQELYSVQTKLEKQLNTTIPLFIGSDLNATPHDAKNYKCLAYNSIINGDLFLQNIKEDNKLSNHNQLKKMLPNYKVNFGLNLSSAYKDGKLSNSKIGDEPLYTTWKVRPGKEAKHTIDYIFYQPNKNVILNGLLSIPTDNQINNDYRLPGWEYPSDHFAIMAQFSL